MPRTHENEKGHVDAAFQKPASEVTADGACTDHKDSLRSLPGKDSTIRISLGLVSHLVRMAKKHALRATRLNRLGLPGGAANHA